MGHRSDEESVELFLPCSLRAVGVPIPISGISGLLSLLEEGGVEMWRRSREARLT